MSKTQSVGINCAECDVTTSSLGHEFDYVFASDVIEHVENPVAFLRNIRDSLSSDGIMIITTPNALYWRNILTGCSREFYEHNFTFYPAHFRNLARRLDLDIAELCSFQAVGRLSGLVAKSLHCCVHRFMAQIGRGNSLLFVARRL